jgi:glycosyltransferase involved in cell wall biosynthesis
MLEHVNDCETIVVDGGSEDRTISLSSKYVKTITTSKGKAIQMNAGAHEAKGDILFFVHADMTLAPDTLSAINEKIYTQGNDGGGFKNIFSTKNDKIKRLGRILNLRPVNREQPDKLIFYGDNGLFVRKSVFNEMHGFKEIPIMEDYDFSFRMKNKYKVAKIDDPKIIVDSRRHVKAGFFKTRMQWILIRILYKIGISPFILAKWYADVR